MTEAAPPPLSGVAALRAALETLPKAPGIYRMLDAAGKPIYIGKAKNLHSRVASYTSNTDLNNRIMRMVAQISAVEVIVTRSEAEALLMEASLIRRFLPRYNVLLKDDKSFPYLRLDTGHRFPRIEKHRGAQNKPGEYFGPFANVKALNETITLLQKIFQLRPCADTIFKNRSRPCLQYQIKRCSAPCVGYVTPDHYKEQLDRARGFLKGRHRDVQEALAREMNEASATMNYEKAALLRDRIHALTQVQQEQGLRTSGLNNADVIALARSGDKSVVQVFFFRGGSHFGNQSFYPRHAAEDSNADILAGFIGQFYQAHLPPEEIILSAIEGEPPLTAPGLLLLEQALSLRAGRKVEIRVPQRGDKLALLADAQANANSALARQEMEHASVAANLARLLSLFDLPLLPQRIEVYDNSHIMGTHAVAAFIVATQEGFDKKSYRSFTIKDTSTRPGDDYAMMREIFCRRFKGFVSRESLVASNETNDSGLTTNDYPDLILIDGGSGQLRAAGEALAQLGVTGMNLVAIAKGKDRNAGREWFFQPGRTPFQLPVNDPALHYLQRLRDEAHRFAIGHHRNKRSRSLTESALDDITGIGASRKRGLLLHFGSRSAIETASLTELENVSGISRAIARRIYDYFHG